MLFGFSTLLLHECLIFCRLVGCLLPWQFSVAENGKIIAILQDTALEIRSSKDEYSSVIGKATGNIYKMQSNLDKLEVG